MTSTALHSPNPALSPCVLFPFFYSAAGGNVSPQYWTLAPSPSFAPSGAATSVGIRDNVAVAGFGDSEYIFESSNLASTAGWSFMQSVQAGSGMVGDYGSALAVGNGVIAVGAPSTAASGGYVSIYERSQQSWSWQTDLLPPDPQGPLSTAGGVAFGSSVAIDGDTLVVGAENFSYDISGVPAPSNFDQIGMAYVYQRTNQVWTLVQRLSPLSIDWLPYPGFGKSNNPPLPMDGYGFGHSVAISGDWIAIGAADHDCRFSDLGSCGRVYLYRASGGLWAPNVMIKPMTDAVGFGNVVALDGNHLAVRSVTSGSGASGPHYVEVYLLGTNGTWAFIAPPVTTGNELKQRSLALTGDSLLVGANGSGGTATNFVDAFGIAGVLRPTWSAFPTPTGASAEFGGSVSASGNWAIVGDGATHDIHFYWRGVCP
jgi:hypothetical protein